MAGTRVVHSDLKLPPDTNGVERALRGVAVGRKVHYGSQSEQGTRGAALFYSLIESAKVAGVEPPANLGRFTSKKFWACMNVGERVT